MHIEIVLIVHRPGPPPKPDGLCTIQSACQFDEYNLEDACVDREVRIESKNAHERFAQTFTADVVDCCPNGDQVSCCGALNRDLPLTTVAAIRHLNADEAAKSLPVKLRGVITYHVQHEFLMFVEDETCGIYVSERATAAARELPPGTVVEVEGLRLPGRFAPIHRPVRTSDRLS